MRCIQLKAKEVRDVDTRGQSYPRGPLECVLIISPTKTYSAVGRMGYYPY